MTAPSTSMPVPPGSASATAAPSSSSAVSTFLASLPSPTSSAAPGPSTTQTSPGRPRLVLICHADDRLNRDGLARWCASWAELVGIVEIVEDGRRFRQRLRREFRRVGALRLLDVLAFRLLYRWKFAAQDYAWEAQRLAQLQQQYPAVGPHVPVLTTSSPNTAEVEAFLRRQQPDLTIARCKTLLRPGVFEVPRLGTYVLHPGICPQYRNAHGCFWALAMDDIAHVGLTLLKIDRGIDTGPVWAYFRCPIDPLKESHHVIQQRVCFDNLDELESVFRQIVDGTAQPIPTAGLPSGEWGQPWLTAYLRYQRRFSQRTKHAHHFAVP